MFVLPEIEPPKTPKFLFLGAFGGSKILSSVRRWLCLRRYTQISPRSA